MTRTLLIVFLLLIWAFFSACDEELAQPNFVDQNPDDVEIRIANESGFMFENFRINTSSNEWTYGSVFKGGKTTYRKFGYAYPFFELYFEVNDKSFFYQPNDYKGYNKISGGKYSALIYNVDTIALTFSFRLEED